MRNLKRFETVAELNAAIANSTIGLVGLAFDDSGKPVVKTKEVKPEPPTPSHEYVEIGGIKWATMNIGASTIYEPGLYFQWGDTQGYTASQVGEGSGQKYFGQDDYKWYNGSSYTKYNGTDGKTTLDLTDDAVHAAWGGNWRLPTVSDIETFIESTDNAWVYNYSDSGVDGWLFSDKTDNTKVLFFPDCGVMSYGYQMSTGCIFILTNSYDSDNVERCSVFGGYYDESSALLRYSDRWPGNPCRGVLDD